MRSLRISLAAPRYAGAVLAMWRARRHWHQLDQALVQLQQKPPKDAAVKAAVRALEGLDAALDGAVRLLTEEGKGRIV